MQGCAKAGLERLFVRLPSLKVRIRVSLFELSYTYSVQCTFVSPKEENDDLLLIPAVKCYVVKCKSSYFINLRYEALHFSHTLHGLFLLNNIPPLYDNYVFQLNLRPSELKPAKSKNKTKQKTFFAIS